MKYYLIEDPFTAQHVAERMNASYISVMDMQMVANSAHAIPGTAAKLILAMLSKLSENASTVVIGINNKLDVDSDTLEIIQKLKLDPGDKPVLLAQSPIEDTVFESKVPVTHMDMLDGLISYMTGGEVPFNQEKSTGAQQITAPGAVIPEVSNAIPAIQTAAEMPIGGMP